MHQQWTFFLIIIEVLGRKSTSFLEEPCLSSLNFSLSCWSWYPINLYEECYTALFPTLSYWVNSLWGSHFGKGSYIKWRDPHGFHLMREWWKEGVLSISRSIIHSTKWVWVIFWFPSLCFFVPNPLWMQ